MQSHLKIILLVGLSCIGLFHVIAPQVIVAARNWWRQFWDENFDQIDLGDLQLGRPRRDFTVRDYRGIGIGLIVMVIVLGWLSR